MLRQQIGRMAAHQPGTSLESVWADYPVALEPSFAPLRTVGDLVDPLRPQSFGPLPEPTVSGLLPMVRCRVRVSAKHQVKWAMAEHFPRQLIGVRDRVAFEVSGNADGVEISLVCAADDLAIVNTAFEATFSDARL